MKKYRTIQTAHKNHSMLVFILLVFSLALFIGNSGCKQGARCSKQQITIFTAMGMKNVVQDICAEYEDSFQVDIVLNFASSGTLSRQVANGAQCDIILLANKKWAFYLDSLRLIHSESYTELVQNTLMLVVPKSQTPINVDFNDPDKFINEFRGNLAMGNPAYVPAGMYAQEAIKNLKWDYALQNRTIYTKDVRSALKLVEMNEAKAGIVYATDALLSDKISMAGHFPDSTHQPIIFVGAMHTSGDAKAQKLFRFFRGRTAAKYWKKYGFTMI
jgi:molybdate transport system substrate-binding protein